MLYRTTRGKHDVVTAYKTVHTDHYVDGGLFLPFRMPRLDPDQIAALSGQSATQIVANVLNELFGTALTDWDVELAIGRRPIRMATIGRQITAGEWWQPGQEDVSMLIQALSLRIGGNTQEPTNWMRIAVPIALLFASFAAMQVSGAVKPGQRLDVAMDIGDFSLPIAAWYARKMGLPLGDIICGCNANGGFWDLLNRGELATGERRIPTWTPDANEVLPRDLERLIHGVFGVEENKRFLSCCQQRQAYVLTQEQLQQLCQGLFTAVVSDHRVASIIPGVYRTRSYILGPYGALAYGSLQDLRATCGGERPTLLVCSRSPLKDGALVSRLLKLREAELKKRMTR